MPIKDEHIADIQASIANFPSLHLRAEQAVEVGGEWYIEHNGELLETYGIRITFDDQYPQSLPKVYETSGKIKPSPDTHFNSPDWHACLFVSHQRWEVWPAGSSFKKFLEIPVHNFFLGQAHYAAYGYWPNHRERGHGHKGIVEYYQDILKCKNPKTILSLLSMEVPDEIFRQRKCPCNRRHRLKNCHGDILRELRANQDPSLMSEAIDIFQTLATKD